MTFITQEFKKMIPSGIDRTCFKHINEIYFYFIVFNFFNAQLSY